MSQSTCGADFPAHAAHAAQAPASHASWPPRVTTATPPLRNDSRSFFYCSPSSACCSQIRVSCITNDLWMLLAVCLGLYPVLWADTPSYSCTPDLPAPPPAHRRRPPPPLLPPRPVQGNEKATCTSCRSARLIKKLSADRRTQRAGSVHSQDLAPAPRLCTLTSSTSGSDCEPFPGLLIRIRNRSDGARSVSGFSHLGISVASSDHPYLAPQP